MNGFERIERILVDILGETKRGFNDNGQGQFNCPCCAEYNGGIPDGKHNLEVNLLKMQYMCWKCAETDNTRGRLSHLVKKYGTPSQYKEFKEEVKSLVASKLYELDGFEQNVQENVEEDVLLPKTFTRITKDSISRCRQLCNYLNERKIGWDTINRYNLGYTTYDESDYTVRKRLIIPSYDEYGDLNYWVGRDFTGKSSRKYQNCKANKKAIVFQESLINYDADIILVEGAIDCLRYPNAVSMLGKSLSSDMLLYERLMSRANGNVIICLDADTTISETLDIYRLLDRGRLKDRIYYLQLGRYKDFSEVIEKGNKRELISIIKGKNKFEEKSLI